MAGLHARFVHKNNAPEFQATSVCMVHDKSCLCCWSLMTYNIFLLIETGEARNALESYVLEMRGRVQDGDLAPYTNAKEKDPFLQVSG